MSGPYKSEADFSRAVVHWLQRAGDACQHHDDSNPGLADISFAMPGIGGWLELKECRELNHGGRPVTGLTAQQQRFLELRGGLMTHCFLLVATDVGCYLFHHSQLRGMRLLEGDTGTWAKMRLSAAWFHPWIHNWWDGKRNWDGFTWDTLLQRIAGTRR